MARLRRRAAAVGSIAAIWQASQARSCAAGVSGGVVDRVGGQLLAGSGGQFGGSDHDLAGFGQVQASEA